MSFYSTQNNWNLTLIIYKLIYTVFFFFDGLNIIVIFYKTQKHVSVCKAFNKIIYHFVNA